MLLNVASARLGLAPFRSTEPPAAELKTTPSPATPRSPGLPAEEPETAPVHEVAVFHEVFGLPFHWAKPGRATTSLPVTEPLVAWMVALPAA